MDPETRFSEEEVQKILARAVQRQDRAESAPDAAPTGLSLVRLQEVASDVGISPAHVEQAAREVLLRREEGSGRLAGLPREVRALRSAPVAVTDAQWERMVAEFRRIFKKNGIPSQFGAVREWVSTSEASDSMPVVVRLEPDGSGGTRISVHQSVTSATAASILFGGVFSGIGVLFGVLVGLGVLESAAMGFALFMGTLGVVAGTGIWLATHFWSQHQQGAVEQAADRAEIILRS